MGKAKSFAQRLIEAFTSRDETLFKKTLDEMPEDGTAGQTVHVHVNGAANDEPRGEDDPDEAEKKKTADAIRSVVRDAVEEGSKEVKASVDALGKRMDSIEEEQKKYAEDRKRWTKDDKDPDPEGKAAGEGNRNDKGPPNKEASGSTGDEAAIGAIIADVRSRAEILVPGIAFPTFDAKGGKATVDSLCEFKRTVLAKAYDKDKGILPASADLKAMTCDSVDIAFFSASETYARTNNIRQQIQTDSAGRQSMAKATGGVIADIQKKNQDFWQGKH